MKASLCLEAAERPQWPRLYSLGRPRSCDRMPSLVGDRGPVLRVLGWALTRMRNISLVPYVAVEKKAERWLCIKTEFAFFTAVHVALRHHYAFC